MFALSFLPQTWHFCSVIKISIVPCIDDLLNRYYYKKKKNQSPNRFSQLSLKHQQYYKQIFLHQIFQHASCYNVCNVFNEQGSLLLDNWIRLFFLISYLPFSPGCCKKIHYDLCQLYLGVLWFALKQLCISVMNVRIRGVKVARKFFMWNEKYYHWLIK